MGGRAHYYVNTVGGCNMGFLGRDVRTVQNQLGGEGNEQPAAYLRRCPMCIAAHWQRTLMEEED